MSKVVILCSLLIQMLFRSCATSFEILVAHVYGSFINWLSFLLRYLASLYDGVYMLFITGLIVFSSLCILIKALSFGAMGFMCIKYFCWLFIYYCVTFVFEMIPWDLYLIILIQKSVVFAYVFCVFREVFSILL